MIRVATLPDLVGPWRAIPLRPDPAMADRIADTCAHDMQGPANVPAQIIDVRGGGVAIARLSGPTVAIGCDALQITAAGNVDGAGGGWLSNEAEVLDPIGDAALENIERATIEGGALKIRGWSVNGRAGPAIAAVIIEPEGGPTVTATLENGRFAGWWPGRLPGLGNRPGDQPAVRIRGFDASGTQVAETILERGS